MLIVINENPWGIICLKGFFIVSDRKVVFEGIDEKTIADLVATNFIVLKI